MTEETEQNPAQSLAEKIVDQLIDEGLATLGKKAQILAKLTAGTAKAEDWGLWTELAQQEDEEAQEETRE